MPGALGGWPETIAGALGIAAEGAPSRGRETTDWRVSMSGGDFTEALTPIEAVDLTVTERASGRESTRPVWFVQDGDTLYLLPARGSDTPGLKSVLKTSRVRVSAGEDSVEATARPITDPERVRDVVERFRAKYGADRMTKYYSKLDVAVAVPLR